MRAPEVRHRFSRDVFVHKAKSESEHRSTGLGLGFGFEAQIGDLEVGGSLGSWGPRSVLFGLRS